MAAEPASNTDHLQFRSLTALAASFAGQTVILAGCGGGADVYGGLPMVHALRQVGATPVMTNFSFTNPELLRSTAKQISPCCFRVDPQFVKENLSRMLNSDQVYYAEAMMARYIGAPVYAIPTATSPNQPKNFKDMADAYRAVIADHAGTALAQEEGQRRGGAVADEADGSEEGESSVAAPSAKKTPPKVGAFFLIDGGCDVLLRGDETGLATFVEDMFNLRAVQELKDEVPYLGIMALGANVDCAHGVVQEELDERLADLRARGIMTMAHGPMTLAGSAKLDGGASEYYYKGCMQSAPWRTIVQSLVCAGMEGHLGMHTPDWLKKRIGASKVPTTDQTCTLFAFDLLKVAAECYYLPYMKPDASVYTAASRGFDEWRATRQAKKKK